MFRALSVLSLVSLAACGTPQSAGDLDPGDPFERVSCDPTMHVFPVGDAHNIGYDHSSCGTGTCEISCPDANANSDWGGAHHGIDVFAYQGAPLVAVTDADVVAVGVVSATSGLRVRLRDACGWEYYYGHLDQAVVSPGDHVRAGQLIGTMGYTGTASTHLHFNVSPDGAYSNDIDPFDLLNSTSPTACGAAPEAPEAPAEPGPGAGPLPGCGIATGTTHLAPYSSIASCDGRFELNMQGDGNLVLYKNGSTPLWNTYTHGNPGAQAFFQEDGNLVVYSAGMFPLWSSDTFGNPGAHLAVQDDGNLVIYQGTTPLWHTFTHGH